MSPTRPGTDRYQAGDRRGDHYSYHASFSVAVITQFCRLAVFLLRNRNRFNRRRECQNRYPHNPLAISPKNTYLLIRCSKCTIGDGLQQQSTYTWSTSALWANDELSAAFGCVGNFLTLTHSPRQLSHHVRTLLGSPKKKLHSSDPSLRKCHFAGGNRWWQRSLFTSLLRASLSSAKKNKADP